MSRVESRGARAFRPLLPVCTALFLARSSLLGASRPEAEQNKIDWLLAEIGNSKGTFIRNGKEYDATRAASYLRSKLNLAGSRVQTVRDFIESVASRSSQSGKPYEIRLADGKQQPMEVWLLERLAVYEGAAAQKPPAPTPSPPAGGTRGVSPR